jgi:hypothetical protein
MEASMTVGSGWLIVVASLLGLAGCAAEDGDGDVPTTMAQMKVPASFSYETVRDVELDVTARWPDRSPAVGIVVMVFTDEVDPPGPDQAVAKFLTGSDGRWIGTVSLPGRMEAVPLVASLVGVSASARVPIEGGRATVVFQPAEGGE